MFSISIAIQLEHLQIFFPLEHLLLNQCWWTFVLTFWFSCFFRFFFVVVLWASGSIDYKPITIQYVCFFSVSQLQAWESFQLKCLQTAFVFIISHPVFAVNNTTQHWQMAVSTTASQSSIVYSCPEWSLSSLAIQYLAIFLQKQQVAMSHAWQNKHETQNRQNILVPFLATGSSFQFHVYNVSSQSRDCTYVFLRLFNSFFRIWTSTWLHGRPKDFSRKATERFFQNFSREDQKWWNLISTTRN